MNAEEARKRIADALHVYHSRQAKRGARATPRETGEAERRMAEIHGVPMERAKK